MNKDAVKKLMKKWESHAVTYEKCEKIHVTEDNPEAEDLCKTAKLILRNCINDLKALL